MGLSIDYTVFTKPWPDKSLPELGKFVHDLGFDGVELPVRPKFQVEPETMAQGLPEAAKILADQGVKISTVAGPTNETAIAACAEAEAPIIRVCMRVDPEKGYIEEEARIQRDFDALVPILDKHGVAIGVQNHCGFQINNAEDIAFAKSLFEGK